MTAYAGTSSSGTRPRRRRPQATKTTPLTSPSATVPPSTEFVKTVKPKATASAKLQTLLGRGHGVERVSERRDDPGEAGVPDPVPDGLVPEVDGVARLDVRDRVRRQVDAVTLRVEQPGGGEQDPVAPPGPCRRERRAAAGRRRDTGRPGRPSRPSACRRGRRAGRAPCRRGGRRSRRRRTTPVVGRSRRATRAS